MITVQISCAVLKNMQGELVSDVPSGKEYTDLHNHRLSQTSKKNNSTTYIFIPDLVFS